MDEKKAWELFCKTGKVKDYIVYTQIKTKEDVSGKTAAPYINTEDDNKNKGTYY